MSISVGFIGRGSFYKELKKHISDNGGTAVNYTHRTTVSPVTDILVNYGLYGEKLNQLQANISYRQFPTILNPTLFGNKFVSLQAVKQARVTVPESVERITQSQATESNEEGDWIAKPYWSFGGRNIFPIVRTSDVTWRTHYAQKRVLNRRYELRVHYFRWMPKADWLVAKRVHPNGEQQLTWNFHQGGDFRNVSQDESNTGVFSRAKDFAEKAAKALNYDFCSVDFIVQNNPGGPLPLFFIEVNTATGFTTDRTREVYLSAFMKLANFQSVAELRRVLGRPALAANPPPARAEEPQPRQMRDAPLSAEQKMSIITQLTRRGITAQDMARFIQTIA